MNPRDALRGLMVATVTPFDSSDRLDYGVIRAHTDFLITGGVSAICPAGTTGEMLYLSVGEKVRLVEETCRASAGRVPVIAGIWALREKEVALLGRAAKAAGATAVFLPPPIYYPAGDDAVYEWYRHASEASELPVFTYNIPSYAANAISMECLERLVQDGLIAGVKDSTGNPEQMTELVNRFSDRISVEAASDAFVSEARKIGAHGFISALANVWPKALARLWGGEEALQEPLAAVRAAIKKAGGISAIKFLAVKRGFTFGLSRIPLSSQSKASRDQLECAWELGQTSGLE
jgi:4-hydroxy-tetrahydrodipicolinate synthase